MEVGNGQDDIGGEYDVIIVGAGPAGLSAALILGRCCRKVLVCDSGKPRNTVSHGVHGFLTRDGILPEELRCLGRDELRMYENVELMDVEVVDAKRIRNHFEVALANGVRCVSAKLLLATGVIDHIPNIRGLDRFYGSSVFHCPYCDGYEFRDQPVAVYGRGKRGYGLSLELTAWSRDLVLCSDGDPELGRRQRGELERQRIPVVESRIEALAGHDGQLEEIVFEDGRRLPRRALFFSTGHRQRSALPSRFGLRITPKGDVVTGKNDSTRVRGLFVTGDASRSIELSIIAASEGAKAATEINKQLIRESLVQTRLSRNRRSS